MDLSVKLFTHESVIHEQIDSLEKHLQREIDFSISLNVDGIRSHIRFSATDAEARLIREVLGYTVYIKKGNQWVPEI